MIHFPNTAELELLRTFDEPNCLSIYAPFIEPSAATNPNKIELKNLLQEAEHKLFKAGLSPKAIKRTLRGATDLMNGPEFWPIQHESLALFMHERLFRSYFIPSRHIDEQIILSNRFALEPLEQALSDNQPYYLLALDHKNVAIFKGDHYGLQRLELDDFPTDMKSALHIDEYPKWREMHEVAPSYMGKGSEAMHGQYDVSQTDKDMLKQFFRLIDKRLRKVLSATRDPLIIAGVRYLQPIYRSVNTYPNIITATIDGNVSHEKLDALRQKAWAALHTASAGQQHHHA